MAEQVILDISIPVSDIEKATAEIGKMRGRVTDLQKANKDLDKSSEAYTKNTLEIKKLNGEIRTNERVLISNTKAQEANKGSVDQLRSELSKVSVQWAKLSEAERENSKEGKALTKQKKDLTDQLKQLEKQTGDTRRNVGNYSEGMQTALKESGLFAREQRALAVAQKVFTAATGGASKGLKLFRIALISTGIGAIVVAVGSLIAAFLSTQRGMDALNKVIKPVSFAFQRLIGIFQDIATALVDLDFSKAWDSLMGIGDALKEGAKDGSAFAKSQVEIKKAQLELAKQQGNLSREYAQQKSILEDVLKTDEDRRKAGEAALNALNKEASLRKAIKEDEIEQAKLLAAQNDTDYEAQIELAKVKGELAEIEAQTLIKSQKIKNQISSIDKTNETKRLADFKKNQEERIKITEAAAAKELQIAEELASQRNAILADEVKRKNDIYILGLKQRLLAEQITREEYDQALLDRELELLELQRAGRVMLGFDTIEIDNKIADIKIANLQKIQNAEKASLKAKQKIQNAELDSATDIGQGLVNVTKAVAGENVGIQKIAGLASIAINISKSIMEAIGSKGPIAGSILGAIASAIGAVQSARIRATPQQFADGVIGLEGPGTATSDSISAKLSKGESVITAKATQVYAPLLAQMESNVGNRPNFQLGNKRFANGIIAAGNLPALQSTRSESSAENRAVDLMNQAKIFVSVTEFEDKQVELTDARRFASIVE